MAATESHKRAASSGQRATLARAGTTDAVWRTDEDYSRLFVQQSESLFGDFESLRQPPLQSLHGLLQGQGELEACAGGGVDVQIHGGLSRDGLARRSAATGAAPGAGVLVHPITCVQRRDVGVETRRAEARVSGVARTVRPLASLVLPAQHSEPSPSL